MTPFPGSYAEGDVAFLLERLELAPTPVHEKERLLQSGQRHYSEMIGEEEPPDAEYLALFHDAVEREGGRMARDVARLAERIAARHRSAPPGARTPPSKAPPTPVLISLARAGTPVGVLLRRALGALGLDAPHYSISIIRDRGIDGAALDWIGERHPVPSWVFVDGWTGKGAIAGELDRSWQIHGPPRALGERPPLAVLADLAGVADLAATADDYLIPCSILGSVVSGLVSRTILARDHGGGFHGCVYQEALAPHDLTRMFIETLTPRVLAALRPGAPPSGGGAPVGARDGVPDTASLRRVSERFVAEAAARWGARDRNRVKPGIGESTRALLRRVPERLVLRSPGSAPVRHLEHLAARRAVPVEVDPALPYEAAVIIRSLGADA